MRRTVWPLVFAAVATPAFMLGACGSDDTVTPAPSDGGTDRTIPDAGDPIARGKYLIDTAAVCSDCHTPRNATGGPDSTRYLAGIDCFIGTDKVANPNAPGPGCLSSPNLTNDSTGLRNFTDQEIKNLFMHGVKPLNRGFLNSVMPYWVYANFTDDDANAVVAYLRTVPAVAHESMANQAPWVDPPQAPPIDMNTVFAPAREGNPNFDSQMRGRYLAATAGACIECHTPETLPGQPDRTRWFAGRRVFDSRVMGLPPTYPAEIFAANLTSDATGLAGYTVEQIVRALKSGLDNEGRGICPPMPAGPVGPYANMTDNDATDIAQYLKALPPIANERTDCVAPSP